MEMRTFGFVVPPSGGLHAHTHVVRSVLICPSPPRVVEWSSVSQRASNGGSEMRRVTLVVLVAVLALAAGTPALAQPAADRNNVRLRVFVHYPRDPGKSLPPTCNVSSSDPPCFGLTGWHLAGNTDYHVNESSIPTTVVNGMTAIRNSFQVWATATNKKVNLSEGTSTTVNSARYDGLNIVAWGNVKYGNAIAVAYTWYDQATGQVVEVDTILSARLPWRYTSVKYPDAQCGDFCCYDVQNILTHEVGHWMGLDDLYNAADKDLTMYGYGAKGELKKDTLGLGDTNGIAAIY